MKIRTIGNRPSSQPKRLNYLTQIRSDISGESLPTSSCANVANVKTYFKRLVEHEPSTSLLDADVLDTIFLERRVLPAWQTN
jgi:hypothetical protein